MPIPLPDEAATARLAQRLAPLLVPGDVIALDGPMGAGKTTWTRAMVAALGGDPAQVSSPTYTLQHVYDARCPVVHVDACRLTSPEQLDGVGFDEARAAGVAVVEWAGRVAEALPERRWRITLEHDGQGGRTAVIEDPAGRPWGRTPVERLATVDGRDPLVATWLATHRPASAVRLLAWPWLLAGSVGAVLGALAARVALGIPAPAQTTLTGHLDAWLGDPVTVLGGGVAGALVTAFVGSRRAMPAGQEPLVGGLVLLLGWLLLWDALIGIGVVTSVVAAGFLAAVGYRVAAVLLGGRPAWSVATPVAPAGGWPRVTLLIPLYREAEVVPGLAASLARLDYPADRLEPLFLCEADDPATVAALEAASLPVGSRIIVVPDALPKTKPRACNHGLAQATGDFLVIYDAEDRPDPDQITQAVAVFLAQPEHVACLQARLGWHNAQDNLLTRLFALEYNQWFRRYLPGLHRLGAPIPLGGTSNHFRTQTLREVGGWDPFNVAEDCDLGVRLHLAGKRTGLLDRTTWEEAVTEVPAWIRQRTRWFKGYLATHAVHGRRPLHLAMRLGPVALLGYLLAVPAVPLMAALGLLLWIGLVGYGVLVGIDLSHGHALGDILGERDWAGIRHAWPLWYAGPGEDPRFSTLSQVMAVVGGLLLLGNGVFIVLAALAGRHPQQPHLGRWALAMPWYWILQGIAAWRALFQAVVSPHRWEKTMHHAPRPVTAAADGPGPAGPGPAGPG